MNLQAYSIYLVPAMFLLVLVFASVNNALKSKSGAERKVHMDQPDDGCVDGMTAPSDGDGSSISAPNLICADDLTEDSRILEVACRCVAFAEMEEDYLMLGTAVKGSDGKYRSSFLSAVQHRTQTLLSKLTSNFPSFQTYLHAQTDPITQSTLQNLIKTYLSTIQTTPEPILKFDSEPDKIEPSELTENTPSMTPEEFFHARESTSGDIVGVYIIHNLTQDKYYVGQAKRVMFRVNQHLTGHGNGDVYADMKMGNEFRIQIVRLVDSGYSDLDKLERDLIAQYHAYDTGYNRTKGNT